MAVIDFLCVLTNFNRGVVSICYYVVDRISNGKMTFDVTSIQNSKNIQVILNYLVEGRRKVFRHAEISIRRRD